MFRDIFADLLGHKARSVLSAISLMIGVLAIIGVSAAAKIAEEKFVSDAEQRDGRAVLVSAQIELPHNGTAASFDQVGNRLSGHIEAWWVRQTREDVSVFAAQPAGTPLLQSTGVKVVSSHGNPLTTHRWKLRHDGRWLQNQGDAPAEVVLNTKAAALLPEPNLLVSTAATTIAVTVQVVGVVEDAHDDPVAYLPAKFLDTLPTLENNNYSVTADVHHRSGSVATLTQIMNDSVSDAGAALSGNPTRTDTVRSIRDSMQVMKNSFLLATVIALVVASLGILNIGLSSVRERARELVIRRALGATRYSIFCLIIGSSLILALLVSALSLLAAWGVIVWYNGTIAPMSPMEPQGFPVEAAVAGVCAGLVSALLGSTYPAWKASQAQVAAVLRE